MKKSELKYPDCLTPLVDDTSSIKCESCSKRYAVRISKKGTRQFLLLLLFLPSLTSAVTLFILDWKIEGFMDISYGSITLYGLMALGAVGVITAVIKMLNEFEIGSKL